MLNRLFKRNSTKESIESLLSNQKNRNEAWKKSFLNLILEQDLYCDDIDPVFGPDNEERFIRSAARIVQNGRAGSVDRAAFRIKRSSLYRVRFRCDFDQ